MFLNAESLFGLLVFLAGLIGTIHIYSSYNKESFIINWQDTFTEKGKILASNKTLYGYGDEISSTSIFGYNYNYIINDTLYEGVGYSTGQKYFVGDSVDIRILQNDHKLSLIKGLRKSPFDLWVLCIIVLPISGLYVLIRGIKLGISLGDILSRGIYTIGKYDKSIETNEKQVDEKLFKHSIEFTDLNGNKCVTSYSSIRKKIKNDIELVYDKVNPNNTFIFDSEAILWKKKIINYCRQQCI